MGELIQFPNCRPIPPEARRRVSERTEKASYWAGAGLISIAASARQALKKLKQGSWRTLRFIWTVGFKTATAPPSRPGGFRAVFGKSGGVGDRGA